MYQPFYLFVKDTYSALSLYTFVSNTGWSISTSTFRRIFRYITGIGGVRAVVVQQTRTFGLLFDILTDPSGLTRCVAITFTQWGIICSIAFIWRISAHVPPSMIDAWQKHDVWDPNLVIAKNKNAQSKRRQLRCWGIFWKSNKKMLCLLCPRAWRPGHNHTRLQKIF